MIGSLLAPKLPGGNQIFQKQIMANQVISLAGLLDFFKEASNTIVKGETIYNADFVLECKIADLTVQSSVRASVLGCTCIDER